MTDDDTDNGASGDTTQDAGSDVPEDVAAASKQAAADRMSRPASPWLNKFVWQSLWKVVAVGFATFFLLVVGWRAQTLLRQLGLALFFALAIIPGVQHLHEKRGWKRGAAVGAIYGSVMVFMIVMVAVLIPAIANFASEIGETGDEWVSQINDTSSDVIGKDLLSDSSGDEAVVDTDEALANFGDNIMGAAVSGIGLVFSLATIALFTFYFAADWPGIQRAMLARMPPIARSAPPGSWIPPSHRPAATSTPALPSCSSTAVCSSWP